MWKRRRVLASTRESVEKVIAKFGAPADEVKGLVGAGLEGGCSRDT